MEANGAKRFERSNGLDAALYKSYLYFTFTFEPTILGDDVRLWLYDIFYVIQLRRNVLNRSQLLLKQAFITYNEFAFDDDYLISTNIIDDFGFVSNNDLGIGLYIWQWLSSQVHVSC